jgi:hypothetical protein
MRSNYKPDPGAISFSPSYAELCRQRGELPITQLQSLVFGS